MCRFVLKFPLTVFLVLGRKLTAGLHVISEPIPLVAVLLLMLRQGLSLKANAEGLQNTAGEGVEEGDSGNIGR